MMKILLNVFHDRLALLPSAGSLAGRILPLIACASLVQATPDRVINIDERLVGIGDGGHAIMRTETDNQGSHYSFRKNLYLDEYVSGESARKLVKSTHLLDVTSVIDANHIDPNTPPPVEHRVAHEDKSIAWASILLRYPRQEARPWPKEQMDLVTSDPAAGVRFRERLILLDAKTIREAFAEEGNADFASEVESIVEVDRELFVQIMKSVEDGEGTTKKIFHVSAENSQLVSDQLDLKPSYLAVGSYDRLDEAIAVAEQLKAKARDAKVWAFNPEVWEERHPAPRTSYVIVQRKAEQGVDADHQAQMEEVLKLQNALGVDLVSTSSEHFWKRTKVD